MTLITTANLANDAGFRSRVQAAMTAAALNVAAEAVAGSSSLYQLRHQLAVAVLNNTGGYLDRFAWAAASDATVQAGLGVPVAIVSSTAVNPSVLTTAVHGLATGDVAEIAAHAVNTAVNGTFPVTVLTTTTFSVAALGSGVGAATGTVTKQPADAAIQNAVNADWNDIAGAGVTT